MINACREPHICFEVLCYPGTHNHKTQHQQTVHIFSSSLPGQLIPLYPVCICTKCEYATCMKAQRVCLCLVCGCAVSVCAMCVSGEVLVLHSTSVPLSGTSCHLLCLDSPCSPSQVSSASPTPQARPCSRHLCTPAWIYIFNWVVLSGHRTFAEWSGRKANSIL